MQEILLFIRHRPMGARTLSAILFSLWIILAAMLLMAGLTASSWGQGSYQRRILFENPSVRVV